MTKAACIQFGRLPTTVIASGALHSMLGSTLKVYSAIAAYTGRDWSGRISIERLMEITGLSESTVRLGIKDLVAKHLMTVAEGGDRHLANTYRLSTNPVTLGETRSATRNPVILSETLSPEKPCHMRTKTLSKSTRNPVTQDDTPSEVQSIRVAEPPKNRADSKPPENVIMQFAIKRGTWGLTQAKADEYRQTYPGLDVDAELAKARQWCTDKTTRRKTPRGMPAFLNSWLKRAAENHSTGTGGDLMACQPVDESVYEAALAAERSEGQL